jgi:hypothetical protein
MPLQGNTVVKRYAHTRDLRKARGKLSQTPENIRWGISEYLSCVKRNYLQYTFPQSLYELKLQLDQQLAHAQTFDRGVLGVFCDFGMI